MTESQATVNRSRVAQSSSNPLLLNVIKQIEQPVMVVDDDLFILQVNSRAECILHGTTRETRQCHLASVLRTTGIATQIQAAITHHKPSVFHGVFLQPTTGNAGQKITLKVAPLDPGSGDNNSLIFIQHESHTKQVLNQLDAMQPPLGAAVDNADRSGWEWEPQTGRYRELDLSHTSLGYGTKQTFDTDHAVCDRLHPDDQDSFREGLRTVANGSGGQFEMTQRHRCKNGDYRSITSRGNVVERNSDGEAVLVAGSYVDLSGLKEIEARISRRESELDLVLESSRQCMWKWNIVDNSLSLSRSRYQLFGYTQTEVAEKFISIASLAHPEDTDEAHVTLVKALKGEIDLYDFQQRMRHKDGH